MANLTETQAVEEAKKILKSWGHGDDLELDDKPSFSHVQEGTWVSAWVWVPDPEYEDDDDDEESE